jgi:glycosyltransferase involved in cell wall biosynthesis
VSRVAIGIHAYECPDRLRATVRSIREHTTGQFDLLLLPDGPDAATADAIAAYDDLPALASSGPRGAAAAFNRLASHARSDVAILIESGCRVAPGWLEPLLNALADPATGLAGPSTNNCWNEQARYPRCANADAEIAKVAREAASTEGPQIRTLEPLYSLADFCYAVRRDVIDAIGEADEHYDLGPCWEMDYNVRAARAGFRGVWVCGSFVYRPPFTTRRRVEEARRFEASRRRYQDKFCGARLRGDKTDYRVHCRGDACPNLAPASLIEIRGAHEAPAGAPVLASLSPPAAPPPRSTGAKPLVTCIMPTADRSGLVGQSIRNFLRQDYPHLELVVLDDGAVPAADAIPDDPRIRYERLDKRLTVGAKRNLACERAQGDVIVHWDDDDWYPPSRVTEQVRALMDRPADVCGTSRLLYYEGSTDRAWEYRYNAGPPRWLAGNTLAYRKDTWRLSRFPDVQVGEDALFLWNGNGKRVLGDLTDVPLCVGMIHPGNTSRKETGGAFWQPMSSSTVHAMLGDDLHFYRGLPISDDPVKWPLVSCIMPTYNRRGVVPLAIQSFLRQDYPHRELIVIDDGDDPVEDLVRGRPHVRYCRLPGRRTIGAKRNAACEQARGDIVAHWDDDDWYAPERLRYQIAPLLAGQADITGLESSFVLETGSSRFWTTRRDLHRKMFLGDVHGGTLVFLRQLFVEGLRYPDVNLAEDAWLLHLALARGKRLLRLANPGLFVYVRHGRNAWRECIPGRFMSPDGWVRVSRPAMFSAADLSSYERAAASM